MNLLQQLNNSIREREGTELSVNMRKPIDFPKVALGEPAKH